MPVISTTNAQIPSANARAADVASLVKQALAQTTETQADVYWAKADEAVMSAAAVYPITADEEFAEHASYVHNAVYIPIMQQFDAANVWLSNA